MNAYLLITFDGDSEEQLDEMIEQASEVLLEAGALDILVADTPQLKKDAWAARSTFLEAIEANTKLLDESDVVVPVNEIAHYVNFINEIAKDYDFEVKSFGHAGDGNLHIYNCSNDMDPEEFKRQVAAFMKRAYGKATELGGLISGEHGIGLSKRPYFLRQTAKENLQAMNAIKTALDPQHILNNGKSYLTGGNDNAGTF